MKQFGGWHFPDHEEHLLGWMQKVNHVREGRQAYQFTKLEAALKWCKRKRTCCDIGGHIGLWSYYLAGEFDDVHAFEPVAEHRECFMRNVTQPNVILYPMALGEKDDSISIHTTQGSSGDSWIDGAGDILLRRLDDFHLQDVDFIKLDCEGAELYALKGGEETLKRCMPCVIVEQKPGRAPKFGLPETGAVDYLKSLGAILRKEMSGDFILTWD